MPIYIVRKQKTKSKELIREKTLREKEKQTKQTGKNKKGALKKGIAQEEQENGTERIDNNGI